MSKYKRQELFWWWKIYNVGSVWDSPYFSPCDETHTKRVARLRFFKNLERRNRRAVNETFWNKSHKKG